MALASKWTASWTSSNIPRTLKLILYDPDLSNQTIFIGEYQGSWCERFIFRSINDPYHDHTRNQILSELPLSPTHSMKIFIGESIETGRIAINIIKISIFNDNPNESSCFITSSMFNPVHCIFKKELIYQSFGPDNEAMVMDPVFIPVFRLDDVDSHDNGPDVRDVKTKRKRADSSGKLSKRLKLDLVDGEQ